MSVHGVEGGAGQHEREPSAHTSLPPELQDARSRQEPGLQLGWVHLHCFG